MNDMIVHTSADAKTPVVFEREGRVFTNSRDVAAFFGREHKNVLQAFDNLDCSERFRALNFQPTRIRKKIGAAERKVRAVDMTRDGFIFLVIGFTGAKAAAFKEAYIERFNFMESALKNRAAGFAVPQTLSEALRLAADQAETIERQRAQIAAAKSMVKAYNRIANSDGLLCLTDAAKALGQQPRAFIRWLFAQKRIYKRIYKRPGSSRWVAYQASLQAGYFEHKVHVITKDDGTEKAVDQVMVTPKGVAWLARQLGVPVPADLFGNQHQQAAE
jgi:Rha family phage regulatory protein